MNDAKTNIQELKNLLKKFVNERDWGQFHSPSNIAKSLIIEAAELLEHFQWIDSEASKKEIAHHKKEVSHEMADVLSYVLSLSEHYNIDLTTAVREKLIHNAQKYPVEKSKGKTLKYTDYNN